MAWPEGIPPWLKGAWGVVSGSVNQRMSTREVIDSLRPYAEANPGGWGPRGVIYVAQLRSMAASIRESARQVSDSGFSGRITSEHISEAPWARSAVQRELSPKYSIRALVSFTNPDFLAGIEGAPETLEKWINQYTARLPADLETLTSQVATRAEDDGSPPTPVLGISSIEILEE